MNVCQIVIEHAKPLSLFLAAIGLITGIVAACYWYKASQVTIDPGWGIPGLDAHIEPVVSEMRQLDIEVATANAFHSSGYHNKWAALWTAASVILNAISSFLSSMTCPT